MQSYNDKKFLLEKTFVVVTNSCQFFFGNTATSIKNNFGGKNVP